MKEIKAGKYSVRICIRKGRDSVCIEIRTCHADEYHSIIGADV